MRGCGVFALGSCSADSGSGLNIARPAFHNRFAFVGRRAERPASQRGAFGRELPLDVGDVSVVVAVDALRVAVGTRVSERDATRLDVVDVRGVDENERAI